MSNILNVVESIELKLNMLMSKLHDLEQSNMDLQQQLNVYKLSLNQKEQEITTLRAKNDTLRMANSLLGSNENKKDTKLKINSLIRDIDYCIAQLSD
ncbi:hypothetical protein B0A58_09885 [Flavobacterium branchiophilum NBRC 15030 = ATCC 35035]|uniref:Mis12-Mtw1 protein family n=2 Tax=Flavobacterium branchiophilum TaxID=55197 RepID=G2Z3M9_FLABF|nr:hypothetical protein [Flavobacterium branchiophilum]OXA74800.1 hypothetical protein B0A58_09885 [Flavobacterium branchiophilum NBRC 15030 = ATCC 35035]TQM41343.1 hypothetical protein BC670_2297 [Flavobacterium branchiophilum]GEM55028.1 hypothetical protein FB1_12490 [Flavobacterium branchiophilum NBRC 15030 = ATCC 35035]CCB70482.1 Protein of unknown function [Flavobacterium branchiophilum FL-15]